MTITEMLQRKQELGYSYEQIANLSGLPLSTVQKVLGGITKSPRYDTIRALEEVLQPTTAQIIAETPASCSYGKKQGEFTIEDYFYAREDTRIELIDGVIYDMASPAIIHQLITGQLYTKLFNFIKSNDGKCIVLFSPVSVQLDCDDKTMVEPDIVIVCDREKFQKVIYGAPDFVAEILSASTRKRDLTLKLAKYAGAGVREYWIVDPDKKRVLVYDLETGDIPEIYTFDHEVPVKIFGGKCIVDFHEIFEYIEFMYEKS